MKNTRTKWEGQNRSFKGDLRFGKLCEDVIRKFLMHYVTLMTSEISAIQTVALRMILILKSCTVTAIHQQQN